MLFHYRNQSFRLGRSGWAIAVVLLLIVAWALPVAMAEQPAPPIAPEAADAVTYIYWTDQVSGNQSGEIWRANADGSNAVRLVNGLERPHSVVLDVPSNRMYWADRSTGLLQRATLDGTNSITFCSGLAAPEDLALDLDAGMIYWTEANANKIRRSGLSSCNPQTVVDAGDGVSDPVGLALDTQNGKIYWTEFGSQRVKRADLSGTDVESLITSGLTGPLEIELDRSAGFIYFVDSAPATPGGGGYVLRATLNGSGLTQIGPQMDNPRGIALDLQANHIYWIDFGLRTLKRMDLSGANVVTLKSGGDSLSDPRSMALMFGGAEPCYQLSRQHTGEGANPTATPPNSTGCPNGQYKAGASINLTADPADGWFVEGWTGTNNDGSTSVSNTTTMPAANHTVIVHYQEPTPCYQLSRQHTGEGANPTATPPNSTGCPNGQYKAGAGISLIADPADGWEVEGWTGTNNNGSTSVSNTTTMPAASHTVIVHYQEQTPCYTLLLQHTGEGENPIPSPPSSTTCPIGQYVQGAVINLTADPASSWTVKNWSGTTNNNSTAITNTAVMPAGSHTVIVNYQPPTCYQLSMSVEGQGELPIASPPNSSACAIGNYRAGTVVSLTAQPAGGWEVAGWQGTSDDSSTSLGNLIVMPAANHQVMVRYRLIPVFTNHGFLPVTLYSPSINGPTCYQGDFEIEPNNERSVASQNGPFCFDKAYRGLPQDEWDVFAYDLIAGQTMTAVVENHRGKNVILQISNIDGDSLNSDSNPADGLRVSYRVTASGRYFVALYVNQPNANETTEYILRATRN